MSVFAWCSIPCTGGSSWQRLNVARHPGVADKVTAHKELAGRPFLKWEMLAQMVVQFGGALALERPRTCSYWQWP
eukprot:1418130-Amphidinium_carterae.2